MKTRALSVLSAVLVIVVAGPLSIASGNGQSARPTGVMYTASLAISGESAAVTTAVSYRVTTTPSAKTAGRTVLLQIDSGTRWRTIDRPRVGNDGVAASTVTSKTSGTKRYRAVLVNAGDGRTLARSTVATFTWTKLSLSPRLTLSRSSSPIRVNVPYSVTVTPAEMAAGMRAAIQVKGRTSWQGVDVRRLNKSGRAAGTVEGYAPGVGRYRVQVLNPTGKVLATSPTVSITYTGT